MNYSKTITSKWLIEPLHPLSIWLKTSVLTIVAVANTSTPTQPSWAVTMVLFAALFLVPIGYQEIRHRQSEFKMASDGLAWHLACTILLAFSFLFNRGPLAGAFAVPYIAWCLEVLLRGLKISTRLSYLATLVTFGFLTNASLWLFFDRIGFQPMGFSTWIVILTGVHFHFAGFALMASLSLFLYQNPADKTIKALILSIILGVVFTALGITATQLSYGNELETFAGVWMAMAATLSSFVFIKHSFSEKMPTRILWLIGGICLALAMILACLYALRAIIPLETLTLPFMQAIHGTLNALGFGTLLLLGWTLKK